MEPTTQGLLRILSDKLNLSDGDRAKAESVVNEWLGSQSPVYEFKVISFNTADDAHMGFSDQHSQRWEDILNELGAQGYNLFTYMIEGCVMVRQK